MTRVFAPKNFTYGPLFLAMERTHRAWAKATSPKQPDWLGPSETPPGPSNCHAKISHDFVEWICCLSTTLSFCPASSIHVFLRYHVPFWLFCHKSKDRKYFYLCIEHIYIYIYIYVHRKILNFINKTNPFEIKSLHLRFILEFVHPNSIAPSIHSTLAPSASPRSVRPLPLLLAAFWRRFSPRQSGPARWDHAEAWQRHPMERSWIARFAACWRSDRHNEFNGEGYESQKGSKRSDVFFSYQYVEEANFNDGLSGFSCCRRVWKSQRIQGEMFHLA